MSLSEPALLSSGLKVGHCCCDFFFIIFCWHMLMTSLLLFSYFNHIYCVALWFDMSWGAKIQYFRSAFFFLSQILAWPLHILMSKAHGLVRYWGFPFLAKSFHIPCNFCIISPILDCIFICCTCCFWSSAIHFIWDKKYHGILFIHSWKIFLLSCIYFPDCILVDFMLHYVCSPSPLMKECR